MEIQFCSITTISSCGADKENTGKAAFAAAAVRAILRHHGSQQRPCLRWRQPGWGNTRGLHRGVWLLGFPLLRLPGSRAVEASDESPLWCVGFLATGAIGQSSKSSKSADSNEWEAQMVSYGKCFKVTLYAHVPAFVLYPSLPFQNPC